jgi:hypothetical protein
MEDIIDIIVTETTNTIEITAQPNDEIIDVNIIDNREDVTLNVTPTVVEININSLTSNFGVEWGDITGTLTDQTDLNTALGLKANLVGGKVPASELPSYVDDVVEVANFASLPATGETGKIYITLDNNKIYRWSGSVYVEIADSTAVWGAITGTLSSQTDLQSALDAKLSVTTAASTYVPYTGATGDVNLGVNVLKSNNVILDGDTSATGYLGFKQYSGAQGGGLGYSSISATGLTKFYFRAYQTGADVKSFNFDLASLTNLTERNYTLPDANGTLALTSNLTAYVPYTGATANVNLGTHTLLAAKGTFSSSGSSDTVGITHSSGSGNALNITKGGNGEGIYVNKSSGSGNAVTIVGTLNATTLVKNGGTSSQFLKADGSVDSTAYLPLGGGTLTGGVIFSSTTSHTGTATFGVGSPTAIDGSDGRIITNKLRLYNTTPATIYSDFVTSATSNRTITIPDASGTMALTSNLSSYLPLSGGTLTGALNGTSATFSSSITSTGLTTGTTSGSSVNITTSGNNGNSASPLQTNLNFYGYNNNLNGQIRVDDIAGTAQIGTMKFYTWNSGQVLALTISQTATAVFEGLIDGKNGIYQRNASLAVASNTFETYNGGSTQMRFNFPTSGSVAFNNGTTRLSITNGGTLINESGIYDTGTSSLWYARQGGNNRIIADGNGFVYMPFLTTGSGIDDLGWWGGSGSSYVSGGMLMRISSSVRYKKNIRDLELNTNKIFDLRTISFENNEFTATENTTSFGLLAEDVAEKIPMLATYNQEGQPEGVQYKMLAVLLLEEMKKMKSKIEILENK